MLRKKETTKSPKRGESAGPPVPVTLLTGFLGSGKTTLLNRILEHEDASRIAVIQNEFGSISIDHELVVREQDGIFEMQNGCLCCTVRDDLVRVLEDLKFRKSEFDRILIETTGVADPVPVAQTFFSSLQIQQDYRLDGIITLVDAFHFEKQLKNTPEAGKQVLCADLIILNKTDLVSGEQLTRVRREIRSINPEAAVRTCQFAEADIASLWDISLLQPDKLQDIAASLMGHQEEIGHTHSHGHSHEHHRHDEAVSSFSLEIDGEMDLERLDAWLNMLHMLNAGTLYRMKGILNIPDEDRMFVFQAVFRILQGEFGRAWTKDEKRGNRFVFIGKNLNKMLLEDGFKACLKGVS